MKQIILDIRSHVKEDLAWKSYGPILLGLGALTAINYYLDLEHSFIDKLSHLEYLLYFLVLYPAVYYTAVFTKSGKAALSKSFLGISAIYLIAQSFSSGFRFHYEWVAHLSLYEKYYLRNVLTNIVGVVWIFIPLTLLYIRSERLQLPNFYGLSFKKHNFWPYLILLLGMLPLIYWASTQEDFLAAYPTMKIWKYQEVYGLTKNQMLGIFEFFYISDFIRVEALFRGALIIGLARFLGKDTILPMAVLYCVIHFNKPLGETISSFFGGYILGVIAYYQKNIVGGVLIHAGIAGLMELVAGLAWAKLI